MRPRQRSQPTKTTNYKPLSPTPLFNLHHLIQLIPDTFLIEVLR
jgi:hypothetical protein